MVASCRGKRGIRHRHLALVSLARCLLPAPSLMSLPCLVAVALPGSRGALLRPLARAAFIARFGCLSLSRRG